MELSRLFPFETSVETESEPRLLQIGDEAADEVFDALSSDTARRILAALHEEPRTASQLAEVTDTSLQNVQYHLDNLGDVDVVDVVDTWYSERGTPMKVYAPADDPLVVVAGDDEDTSLVRAALRRLVGAVAVVGVAWALFRRFGLPSLGGSGGPDGTGAATTTESDTTSPGTATGDRSLTTATDEPSVATSATETATDATETTGNVTATTNTTAANEGAIEVTTEAVTELAGGAPPELAVAAVAVLAACVLYSSSRSGR